MVLAAEDFYRRVALHNSARVGLQNLRRTRVGWGDGPARLLHDSSAVSVGHCVSAALAGFRIEARTPGFGNLTAPRGVRSVLVFAFGRAVDVAPAVLGT